MGQAAVTVNREFERRVLSRLRRLGLRLRSYLLIRGLAALMVGALLAAAIQLGLDYWLRLRWDMRAAMLGVIVLGLLWAFWRRVWLPLRFRFGPREMAALVERRYPRLRSLLVSSVQFATGESGPAESNSPELMRLVVEQASRQTADVPFVSVLDHRRVRTALAAIIVVMAASVGALAVMPEVIGMWFDRNVLLSDAEWPKRTRLVVHLDNGVLAGARGDDLEVRATAEREVPRHVEIVFVKESGKEGRESMVRVGERDFRYTFTRVQEEFRFKLEGGDDETDWFDAELADRPSVEQATIHVTPPGYAGVEPYTLPAAQRAVEVLRGGTIQFDVTLNKAVVRAELAAGQETVQPAEGEGARWSTVIKPDETRTYHFVLVDALNLANKRPTRFSVRVLKDDAPRVRLRVLGVSDAVTPQALLPIEMTFSDTYGLSAAEMVYTVAREGYEPELVELSDFKPGMTQFETKLHWPVSPLGLVPGDRLTLYAVGRDFDDVSGPNEGRSSTATYRVVSTDELLAELARREQEFRQEFERAIEQEEDLRNQLLSLIRRMDEPEVQKDLSTPVATFERRQRQIIGQVNLVRQQFEQILSELEVNGLDTASVQTRLREGVAEPLTELTRRTLPETTDLLRAFGRYGTAESATEADDAVASALADMRRVLASMLKWEGFQEAVTMLREILRLQGELNEETRDEIERRAAELLEGG